MVVVLLIYFHLLNEPINESAIGDIPDQDIREKVKKVCSLFSECTCGSDMLHGSSCCE